MALIIVISTGDFQISWSVMSLSFNERESAKWNLGLSDSYHNKVSVCRVSYDGYVKHTRNDPMCDPWDSQGNEKMQFLFLLLFALTY